KRQINIDYYVLLPNTHIVWCCPLFVLKPAFYVILKMKRKKLNPMRYGLYLTLSLLVCACASDQSQNQTTDTTDIESDIAGPTITDTVEHHVDSGENLLETAVSTRTHIPVKVNDLIGIN